jgi:hypothetical protein
VQPKTFAGGDYSNNSICDTYFTYWKTANYPGLPVSGLNKSRSYTPYLIDTVRLYFEAVDSVVSLNLPITAGNVLQALNGSSAAGILQFDGCTGVVAIDPVTGSRDAALQPPIYDLVSFTSDSWEVCLSYLVNLISSLFITKSRTTPNKYLVDNITWSMTLRSYCTTPYEREVVKI